MPKTRKDYENEGWSFGGTLTWKAAGNRGKLFDADTDEELITKMNEADA